MEKPAPMTTIGFEVRRREVPPGGVRGVGNYARTAVHWDIFVTRWNEWRKTYEVFDMGYARTKKAAIAAGERLVVKETARALKLGWKPGV